MAGILANVVGPDVIEGELHISRVDQEYEAAEYQNTTGSHLASTCPPYHPFLSADGHCCIAQNEPDHALIASQLPSYLLAHATLQRLGIYPDLIIGLDGRWPPLSLFRLTALRIVRVGRRWPMFARLHLDKRSDPARHIGPRPEIVKLVERLISEGSVKFFGGDDESVEGRGKTSGDSKLAGILASQL